MTHGMSIDWNGRLFFQVCTSLHHTTLHGGPVLASECIDRVSEVHQSYYGIKWLSGWALGCQGESTDICVRGLRVRVSECDRDSIYVDEGVNIY